MSDKGCNGWSNYETWLVALWFDNTEAFHLDRTDAVSQIWADAIKPCFDIVAESANARYALSQWAKDYIDEIQPVTTGLFADLITAALGHVDWIEIADHWLSDLDDAPEYEGRS